MTSFDNYPPRIIQDQSIPNQSSDFETYNPFSDMPEIIETAIVERLDSKNTEAHKEGIPEIAYTELENVFKRINSIQAMDYDHEKFLECYDELTTKSMHSAFNLAYSVSTNSARQFKKITVHENEATKQVAISESTAQDFIEVISQIKEPSPKPFFIDLSNDDTTKDFIKTSIEPIITRLDECIEYLPSQIDLTNNLPTELKNPTQFRLNIDKEIDEHFQNSPKFKKFEKKLRKLNELLDDFFNNPEKTLAKWYFESQEDNIEKENLEIATNHIISVCTDHFNQLDKSVLKTNSVHTRTKESELNKSRKKRVPKKANLGSVVSVDPVPAEQYGNIIVTEDIADVGIELPWIDGGKEKFVDVHEIRKNNTITYILDNVITDRLKKIADETRKKDELNKKITNAIRQLAISINEGMMPWNGTVTSIRSLKTNNAKQKLYKNENIWYTFDKSPNAPRVYFVIKDASDIETTSKLNPDSKCIVVVAITDKQNQEEVLKHLTGNHHQQIRANGAGSI